MVDSTYRGKNLGKRYFGTILSIYFRVIDQLVHIGKQVGCYKVILDCAEKNVPFYEKCNFKRKEQQMALYITKSSL